MPQDLISQFDRKYALPIETYRQVQNITQRNAIPAPIRWEGMMCYVISEGLSYVLTAGMENSDWVEFGALVDVTVVDDLLSTSSTDALSANQGRVLQTTKLSDAPSDGNTYGRLDGAWAVVGGGAVDSVFGRTGAVVANAGDYTFAQIGSTPTTLAGYGITDAVPTSRTLTAGTGLTGGGDLTANRSFALDLTYADARYVNVTGDTMTGSLNIRGTGGAPLRLISYGGNQENYINFFESDNSTLKGYFGFAASSNNDIYAYNGYGLNYFRVLGAGGPNGLTYNWNGGNGTLWHSGNDGAGSGLDADLLDGVQGSQFLRSDANDIKTVGYTRYNDQLEVQFGTGNDARLQHDGGQMNLDLTTGGFHIRVGAALERWRLEQNGNTVQFGTATATNFILSSDRRLKKDIEDYTPVHIPIRWREFTWKESGERQIGTIAQETPKQFVTKGADGKLAVKTVEMLMAKVAELEARIINLER